MDDLERRGTKTAGLPDNKRQTPKLGDENRGKWAIKYIYQMYQRRIIRVELYVSLNKEREKNEDV